MIFVLVIGLASAAAFLWSVFLFQKVRYAVMDTLSPEFGHPDLRYAGYPEFALSPTTPLALQGISESSYALWLRLPWFLAGLFSSAESHRWLDIACHVCWLRCFDDQKLEDLQNELQARRQRRREAMDLFLSTMPLLSICGESWSRLSEQNLRLDKWSVCRG